MPCAALAQLADLLTHDLCLVGVGNRLKGDDAAGPALVDSVRGEVGFPCIDAGTAVENHLERIVAAGADVVLIVDAMDFEGRPGEFRLFRPEDIAAGAVSTHALSLTLTADYLRGRCAATVRLLGIQPRTIALGEMISPPVRRGLQRIAAALVSPARDLESGR